MEKNQPIPIAVVAQYIKDVSFENPKILSSLQAPPTDPKISININVSAHKIDTHLYETTLSIEVNGTMQDDSSLFLIELHYAGLFNLPELSEDQLRPLLLIECPRLLFPYARNIISDLTRDGCMPPLMLNPVDFEELYRNKFLETPHAMNA